MLADAIAAGKRVYLFGSGHSVIPVMDVFPRYGSFVGLLSALRSAAHVAQRGRSRRRPRTAVAGTPRRLHRTIPAELRVRTGRLHDRVLARRAQRRAHRGRPVREAARNAGDHGLFAGQRQGLEGHAFERQATARHRAISPSTTAWPRKMRRWMSASPRRWPPDRPWPRCSWRCRWWRKRARGWRPRARFRRPSSRPTCRGSPRTTTCSVFDAFTRKLFERSPVPHAES